MVVIDTDALIEFSRGNQEVVERIRQLQAVDTLATTVFNKEEFLIGLYKNGKIGEISDGKQILNTLKNYDYTQKEIEPVVKVRLGLKKTGKPIGPYDECIAGICIAKNEALFTLNKKHFGRIKELKLV